MVALILHSEIIWYMCFSLSEELSLFFCLFYFWKETKIYLILVFCKEFPIASGVFTFMGHLLYCNAGR